MDDALLGKLDVDGLKPTHQKRSRDLVLKLLNGGLELLRTTDFDNLSIDRLCDHTDVTIGSFYARFETKDAFVEAMQKLVVAQARERISKSYTAGRVPNDSLAHLLAWFVKGTVTWYRENEGFLRASLRRAASDPTAWTPIRDLGEMQVDRMLPHILAQLGKTAAKEQDSNIRFAFQIMTGTLNNMVLINPGPFSIHHPQTSRRLADVMVRLIECGPTG
jgi:AcrR family transcriptional regulator